VCAFPPSAPHSSLHTTTLRRPRVYIYSLLKERCKDYLTTYLEIDKDADDKWEWAEIMYVVKDFYCNVWTKDRPTMVDDDRLEGTAAEKVMKVGR
jgi:hypothetical protein